MKTTITKQKNKGAFVKGHSTWNKGTYKCKRGHDPKYYKRGSTGIPNCLLCKQENAAKYRHKDLKLYSLKSRVRRYGMSLEDYQKLQDAQKGKCAICESVIVYETSHIDHDHKNGKVRGILCKSCNFGLGLLKDSPQILANALKYLNRNNNG